MIEIDHHVDIVAWSAMARIVVSRTMGVPWQRVWENIADLSSHTEWMRDAERIVFTGERRSGVGTRMEVKTVVGPFRTIDIMEVVGWDEGTSIEVVHRGLVTGRGRLSAAAADGATLVIWEEDLTFPWWLGGALAAWLARPIMARIWEGNLERLEASLSSP
jgi:hypothetical protein